MDSYWNCSFLSIFGENFFSMSIFRWYLWYFASAFLDSIGCNQHESVEWDFRGDDFPTVRLSFIVSILMNSYNVSWNILGVSLILSPPYCQKFILSNFDVSFSFFFLAKRFILHLFWVSFFRIHWLLRVKWTVHTKMEVERKRGWYTKLTLSGKRRQSGLRTKRVLEKMRRSNDDDDDREEREREKGVKIIPQIFPLTREWKKCRFPLNRLWQLS